MTVDLKQLTPYEGGRVRCHKNLGRQGSAVGLDAWFQQRTVGAGRANPVPGHRIDEDANTTDASPDERKRGLTIGSGVPRIQHARLTRGTDTS